MLTCFWVLITGKIVKVGANNGILKNNATTTEKLFPTFIFCLYFSWLRPKIGLRMAASGQRRLALEHLGCHRTPFDILWAFGGNPKASALPPDLSSCRCLRLLLGPVTVVYLGTVYMFPPLREIGL
ncbi:uncharacterized protein LOC119562743 [Drosophila subpulchrella]|uniref:uncharacterized protein LOC119562743 n=1 Tax=Drosophila subpulchrella TaxID=1486046 RepID=UPI0018A17780|nr:uncharacterized protein LOC119562743 [Drosophila subpulchrella]